MTDPIAEHDSELATRPALVDATTGETWTYDAYTAHIDQYVTGLRAAGVEPGNRVAIYSETRPEFAFTFFACWRLGATALPLNVRLAPPELAAQLSTTAPELVVTDPATSSTLAEARAQTETSIPVAAFGDLESAAPTDHGDQSVEQSAEYSAEETNAGRRAEAVALLFTSGTTGDPKAVRLTADNFRAAARAHRDRFGVDPDERWLCPLSTYHMGGLAVLVRSAFYGTTAVLCDTADGFDPTATRHALHEYDCTALSIVPVQVRRLLDDGPIPDSLRFVLTGGAPTPPELVTRAHERDVPVCPSYGMTETTSQVATPTPAEAAKQPDSVGTPLSEVDVTLVDDAGDPVETGAIGEIVVDGPTVTPGYLDGDAPFGAFGFHTGDLGRLDDEGQLYVLHRRDDRIITGGENVHPVEVVDAITAHPEIADAAVVGVPDDEWGERVTALVVPVTDTSRLDTAEITEFLHERLAGYKVPKTLAVGREIPRTPSGTVDRDAVRDEIRRLTDL